VELHFRSTMSSWRAWCVVDIYITLLLCLLLACYHVQAICGGAGNRGTLLCATNPWKSIVLQESGDIRGGYKGGGWC
jgi:hypothetical protein